MAHSLVAAADSGVHRRDLVSLPELVVRDRMVSERTVAALRIWAQNCGAVFPRDAELDKTVERARKTLSGASREDVGELQLMFAIGMEPFTAALRAGDHSYIL